MPWTGRNRRIELATSSCRCATSSATSTIGTPGQSPTRIQADVNTLSVGGGSTHSSRMSAITALGWSMASLTMVSRSDA